jgi:hypothetical protein
MFPIARAIHSGGPAPLTPPICRQCQAPLLQSPPSKPVSAAESPFFHLPLELRETIYGLVVARRETLHIMMKRRPNKLLHPLVHRRCRAGGDLDECVLHTASGFSLREGKAVILGHLIPSVGSCGRVEKCMPSPLRFHTAINLSGVKDRRQLLRD